MLHPYLVIKMEVAAVKRWLRDMNKTQPENNVRTSDELFDEFKRNYCNSPAWVYFNAFEDIKPIRTEKIQYLHFHLGLSVRKICKRLSTSPNYVLEVTKAKENKRHFQPHGIEDILPVWENIRKKLPDEIFIKYL